MQRKARPSRPGIGQSRSPAFFSQPVQVAHLRCDAEDPQLEEGEERRLGHAGETGDAAGEFPQQFASIIHLFVC